MIRTHSDDPDVAQAAAQANEILSKILGSLPQATTYDYGGQVLTLGEYDVCQTCTRAIAEAQQAQQAVEDAIQNSQDDTVKEHLQVVADLFKTEATAATLRAELHNGKATEPILNLVNGFIFDRAIHDTYDHSHTTGEA